ncbi:hypothetical protein ACFY12_06040 [Streptomyces sp. NPDC001339]|uniref:hypothetical protein n=1 Tax=Streptomyces sp. NPDC001339 TaxID=3364563 RepID=UPI0036A7EFB8
MRLKFIAPAVVSAALVGTAFTAGTAVAGTPGAARPAVTAKATAADCVSAWAQENVKIRKERKLNSTAVGLFTKDAKTCIQGKGTGQAYDLCNRSGNDWYKITFRGNTGWIPASCGMREV